MVRGLRRFFNTPGLFIDAIIFHFFDWLPDKLFISLRYRALMGKWINWENPKSFTEKLNWLKIYDRKPEYMVMVNKFLVKDYVASKIGSEYIIPTIGVWDAPEDININILPDQFVLKTTMGETVRKVSD